VEQTAIRVERRREGLPGRTRDSEFVERRTSRFTRNRCRRNGVTIGTLIHSEPTVTFRPATRLGLHVVPNRFGADVERGYGGAPGTGGEPGGGFPSGNYGSVGVNGSTGIPGTSGVAG